MLEFDENKGTYKGVPEMREVWIQEEPSGGRHWEWENIRVSVSFFIYLRATPTYGTPPFLCIALYTVLYSTRFFFASSSLTIIGV